MAELIHNKAIEEEEEQHEAFPLLDDDKDESTALLEDTTPDILFHEDAIGDTDSEDEEDDDVSTDGSFVLEDLAMCKSAGRVGSKEKWGHEPLAVDFKMRSVGIEMSDGKLVKVEGHHLSEEDRDDEMQNFELQQDELILKVYLFRVRREIHAVQFVTSQRTSDRFGGTRHGELCKAVEAPDGTFIAGFFGDVSRGEEDVDLGVRFADRPQCTELEVEAEVAEIDQVNCDCSWAELLRSHRPALRLFTCLRAWRFVTLQKKHRLQSPTPREWQQARFFEMELPLHAAVSSLSHVEDPQGESFELLGSLYALHPKSAELLDHQRRPPLYYALEQHWELDSLSWLVDKSLDIVLQKDSEGLALTTHAILNNCPEQLVIRLAVAAASRCILVVDDLLGKQHTENARRFCQRALLDFFAGVPKFPHSRCRTVIGERRQYDEHQARVASTAVSEIWTQFVDTWGHFGIPLLQRDLPETLCPVIDSFVEVSLIVKGEPLTYQWFVQQDGQEEGTPIGGATQSFIFLSPSIQPHNEGVYYCEVVNRRGRIFSTRMQVRVVDDRMLPDPTLNFVVDRSLVVPGSHIVRTLKASAGGRVYQSQTGAAIVFQPDFFTCLDRDGKNVSDSHGVEIAISRRHADGPNLKLRHGEHLVSCLFEVLPKSMGDLLRPALMWLPHFLVSDANNFAIVVEINKESGRVIRDVEYAVVSETFARVVIHRLGVFAVVSRPKTLRNDEDTLEVPVERARLFLLRPTNLSTKAGAMNILLALVRDLANCWGEAKKCLREKADEPASNQTIESFELNIREKFSLNLRINGGDSVVFRWPPPSSEIVVTATEVSLGSISFDDHPTYFELGAHTAVCKTPIQTRTRVHSLEIKSTNTLSADDCVLYERELAVEIPFLRDDTTIFGQPPPTPAILERTSRDLMLDLTASAFSISEMYQNSGSPLSVGNQEDGEVMSQAQPKFSPYFYVVELATFTPTFWRRYDQTWWFDKTKASVLDGMFKVVHRGFDTRIRISTPAYAGCVRVARCSIDWFGRYSEPLLLTPFAEVSTGIESSIGNTRMFENRSATMEETICRLKQLLDDLHIDNCTLRSEYGLPKSVQNATDVVVALLEAKTLLRSCNLELALLMSGFKSLERQISRIKIASESYAKLMERFVRVYRVIPELDWCPVASLPVTWQLHTLLREAFCVIIKLSSPGWMQYLIMDECFEETLHTIFLSTAELLRSNVFPLQCGAMLSAGLEAPTGDSIPWNIKTARSYLLLAVGRLQEATYRPTRLLICHELCHTLQLFPDMATEQLDDECDIKCAIAAQLLAEFESAASQQALAILRQDDSLTNHLVKVTPSDGEKCSCVPEAVHFDLDPFIRGVNRTGMHLVIRVTNASLDHCTVQGKASFDERITRLSFLPAAEFERKTRYGVSVREQEILSSLGGTLPDRPPFSIYFSTPA